MQINPVRIVGYAVIVLLYALVTASPAAANPPRAAAGILDLQDTDLEQVGPLRLSGEWEFYWQELLEPRDFGHPDSPQPSGMISVPGSWNDFRIDGEPVGADGFGTYRLTMRVPDRFITGPGSGATLSIHVPWTFTAYTLWLDGEQVAANGIVGRTADTMVPKFLPVTIPFKPIQNQVELVVQVSNFMHRNGGLWNSPLLGTTAQIAQRETTRMALDMFLVGAILFMAIYHLTLFGLSRERPGSLFLGLTALVIAVRTLVQSEHMLDRFTGGFPWDLQLRIEYLTGYLFLIFAYGFLRTVFPDETPKAAVWAANLIGMTGVALTLLTPVRYSSQFIPLYVLVFAGFVLLGAGIFLLAALRRREGAKLVLVGGLILCAALIHDLLHYNLLGLGINLIPLGLFALLLFESLTLAQRISLAFHHERALARENTGLLQTVRQQLSEVKQSRKMVAVADETLRRNVAEKLHGSIQIRLLTARYRLDKLLQQLQQPSEETKNLVAEVQADLDQLREVEIRQVSHQLHPSIVRVGIVPAVESMVDQFRNMLRVEVDIADEVRVWDDPARNRIPENVRLVAYRALEEACANVQAHADASWIRVSLRVVDNASLHMEVTDDGRGFDPNQLERGLGLSSIEARVDTVGGTWRIDSRVGGGTTVTINLPLDDPGDAGVNAAEEPTGDVTDDTTHDTATG